MNVIIELTPHQAMQMVRWKQYLTLAVTDPAQQAEDYDRKGVLDAINEIDIQVRKKISIDALNDAEAEQALRENKLL
jgi:hypothetical protein